MILKESDIPLIKKAEKKEKSFCYLTLSERKLFYRLLIKRGLEPDDARKRIHNILKQQDKIRYLSKQKNKDKELKKQKKIFEELFR